MVSFISYVAPIMAVLGTVKAGFYTTYPVGADAVNPGQTITIQWKPDTNAPDLTSVKSYTLKFMTGGNLVQTTVQTIGTFDISKTSIPFTIPQTAPGMYFLMYTADNGVGSSWSTRFSISGGTSWYPKGVATGVDPGTTPTDIIVPPSSGASSSAASSSSSSSAAAPSSSTAAASSTVSQAVSSSAADSASSAAGSSSTSAAAQSTDTLPATTSAAASKSKSKTNAASTSVAATTSTPDATTSADITSELTDAVSDVDSSSAPQTTKATSATTKGNGAATRYISLAALVAASVFML
ncbi:hypothetical protein GQ54DRAFT_131718 [Martensiomyces pterosporus]|nr:hypothetical protein GQ54DRAFT_131718 [Martensiomyces pterosporus]